MEAACRACNGQVSVWTGSGVSPSCPGLWWPVAIGNQCRGRRNSAETWGHGNQGGAEQCSLHGQLSSWEVRGLVSRLLSLPSVLSPTLSSLLFSPLSLSLHLPDPLSPHPTLLFRLETCLDLLISTRRLPEAAFFARTYLPSQIPR